MDFYINILRCIRNIIILSTIIIYPIGETTGQEKNIKYQQSENLDCVSGIALKRFKLHKKDRGSSNRPSEKIVLGRKIEYEAKGDNGPVWSWELGKYDGNNIIEKWNLYPVDPNDVNNMPLQDFKKKGAAFIPDDELPFSNGDLGEARGKLKVSMTNNSGIYQDFEEDIKVFFDKDDMNYHDNTVPNWFYYWSDHVKSLGMLDVSGIKMYDTLTGSFSTTPTPASFELKYREDGPYHWNPPTPGATVTNRWGSNEASANFHQAKFVSLPIDPSNPPCNSFRRVMIGWGNINFIINMGQGCGHEYFSYDYGPGPLPSTSQDRTNYKGIEGFHAVLLHELEHFFIMEELWKEGYDSTLDCDGDYVPDEWEEGLIGNKYGFDPEIKDLYNINYQASNLQAAGPSAYFQEERCRRKEVSDSNGQLNDDDWSFDPQNKYQGKQWKKD